MRSGSSLWIVAFACAALSAAAAATRAQPNILLCISDDQSFPHASAYGCSWVKTPAFDRIAREGLLFARAYAPNAKCGPSRASILTGRQSWQLEAAANHVAFYPAGYRSIFEALETSGYAVGYTGKGWAPGDPGQINGRPRQLTGEEYNTIRLGQPRPGIFPADYAANFRAFLAARKPGQPFCFWFGPTEPHRPYAAGSGVRSGRSVDEIDRVPAYWPDTREVREDLLDYAHEIAHYDEHLGRMLALLDEAGELENTIVIVTSDNGMPFPRAKGTTYDVSMHVPFALRWGGGVVRPGRVVEDFVSLIDIAPTLLDATGLSAGAAGMASVEGRSLRSLCRDETGDDAARKYLVFGQERHDLGRPHDAGYPVRGIIQEGFLYFRNFHPERWPMGDPVTGYLNTDGGATKTLILAQNRRGENHWIWELNFGRRPAEELYDLVRDPDCLNNLASVAPHQARRAAMEATLYAELRRQGDPRMAGRGDEFDRQPYASPNRNFHERFTAGEKLPARWVEDGDFESPSFDPERPLAGSSESRGATKSSP